MPGEFQKLPSILDDVPDAASVGGPKVRRRGVRDRLTALDSRVRGFAGSLWTNPKRRRIAIPAAALIVAGAGVGTWLAVRMQPPPNYQTARIDLIFDYTLLTDDFNRLPIEERQRLVGELIRRVSDLDSSESGMLAAFAAGIYGKAREQLEENVSRLMIDTVDRQASQYVNVPPEQRGEFLDQAVLDLMRTVELMGGRVDDRPDSERLADARQQAQRDQEALQSGEFSARAAGTMFLVLDRGIGEHASAHQKARVSNMLRDMTRHLRGGG
ncbi:MAG: hypothetical protein R3B68_04145 [Phycisphaerales bacterium]